MNTSVFDSVLLRDALGVSELMTSRYAYDANGNVEYIGLAKPGTAEDAPGWLIRKIAYDAQQRPVSVTFPDGRANIGQVWDARAGYTYL
ncbi:MAG: hypothetical protein HQL89_00940 [Magnetococcales bacterium]|nr:hypothetical protein [Magnetococcales bacterium]